MPMISLVRAPERALFARSFALAALAATFAAGCQDDPKPQTDGRSSQVPAKNTGTTKPAPSAAAPATASAAAPATASAAAPATASAAAPATASAAASAAAAPAGDPPLDCDAILEPADIAAACGMLVEPAADPSKDDIGAEPTCKRRFASKEEGDISLFVVRHASDAEAKERYKDIEAKEGAVSDVKALTGIGEIARRYVKKGPTGAPIFHAQALKGRFDVLLFNPKITVGPATVGPVCDEAELEKLLAKVIAKVP